MDNRFKDGVANITAPGVHHSRVYTSEYTSWTTLTDLSQRRLYLRTYDSLSYISFDINELADAGELRHVSLRDLHGEGNDMTAALLD